MNRVVFLSSILWASVGFGGTLTGGTRPDSLPREVGEVSFSGETALNTWVGLSATTDSTIAYLDLYGTAARMDLVCWGLDENGKLQTDNLITVLSAQPEDLGGGWSRFAFRGENARVEMKQNDRGWYNSFGVGAGMFILLHDGQYPILEGNQVTLNSQGLPSPYLAVTYDTVEKTRGEILGFPLIVPTRESLDPPFGDATGDGRIDINDFGTLKDGFGQPTTPYQNGDVTGNLTVDMADFGTIKQNFGWKQAAAVPEPSAFGLLGLGILFLVFGKIVPRVVVG